jgi:hypothetical protein
LEVLSNVHQVGSVASCIENAHASVVAAHNMSLLARSSTVSIGCSNLKHDSIKDITFTSQVTPS